ncbi:uncharacterized protein LOC113206341 [Frankliniella occidentalis]|uniref:Regulatory protein zeste n=1 Tax=Frankliniella occidentalis TaxID=133901 RepID=A0A6J1SBZ0_FRAOC|nr:uncharacterized protein LOC113206341 [Frankliniella occidentalis]
MAGRKKGNGKEPKNITTDQRRAMVQFILEHPGCNTGNFHCAHNEKAKVETWEKLTSILNAMPGATKTWQLWMKCYTDWKSECKSKNQHNIMAKAATGNKIPMKNISDLEQICINQLLSKTAAEGNATQDPDDDIVSQEQSAIEIEGDEEVAADTTLSLIDSGGMVSIELEDGALQPSTLLQLVTASKSTSTPVSTAKKPNKRLDSDLRKQTRKRFRKEMELDEDRVVENEHLVAHLAVNNKSADALASLANSLERLVELQGALLEQQKAQTAVLTEVLKRLS